MDATATPSHLSRFIDEARFGDSPVGRRERQLGRVAGAYGVIAVTDRPTGRRPTVQPPAGVRVDRKVRDSLATASRQIGEIIGALSHSAAQPCDGVAAAIILDRLPGTMKPMVSQGAGELEIFATRVDLHLRDMSPAELVALRIGLSRQDAQVRSVHAGFHSVLHERATQELGRRVQEPNTIELFIPEPPINCQEDVCHAHFVNTTTRLQGLLDDGGIDADQVRELVDGLPTNYACAIASSTNDPSWAPSDGSIVAIARASLIARRKQSADAFQATWARLMPATETLLYQPDLEKRSMKIADALNTAYGHFADFRSVNEISGIPRMEGGEPDWLAFARGVRTMLLNADLFAFELLSDSEQSTMLRIMQAFGASVSPLDFAFADKKFFALSNSVNTGKWDQASVLVPQVAMTRGTAHKFLGACLTFTFRTDLLDYIAGRSQLFSHRFNFAIELIDSGIFGGETREVCERVMNAFSRSLSGAELIQTLHENWFERHGLPADYLERRLFAQAT